MGILTDEWEVKLLKHIFGHTKLDIPSNLYLGLHSGTPTESSPSTGELSGSGYSRYHLVDNVHTLLNSSNNSQMHTRFGFGTNDNLTNDSAIDFPEATGSWGTVTHYSVWDDATATTAANCLMIGALSSGVAVTTGDQFRIAVGEFDLNFPNKMGVGAGEMATSGFTTTLTDYYYQATEWRRQVARRLGFINEPWSVHSGVYDFADYSQASSSKTEAFNLVIHNRNGYWPSVSLSYPTDTYTRALKSGNTGSSGVFANSLYLGLYRSDPGNNPTNVDNASSGSTGELYGSGYARQSLITESGGTITSVFGTPSTSSGVSSIANTSAIAFPEATADWGQITHWGIYRGSDDYTVNGSGAYNVDQLPVTNNSGAQYDPARHPFLTGALTTARTVNSGDILRFGIGDFVIKLD
jgi:hypothetical protein